MARTRSDWIEEFKKWSKPPIENEEKKGATAAQMINDALREYEPLKNRKFDVYASGSYRNNTNIKEVSDIDIAIVNEEAFYYQLPSDGEPTAKTLGFGTPAEYGLKEFRADVREALKRKFGPDGFSETNKTFNIHESKRRLDADATVFCLHRRYTGKKNDGGNWIYYTGVETRPLDDPDQRIINWHQQHYDQGVEKNNDTNTKGRFKRIVRILKRLRDDMKDTGNASAKAAAKDASSFLIECLVYNAPNSCFNLEEGSYYKDVQSVIEHLWRQTNTDKACEELLEVSRMKYLFRAHQPWTREQAHRYLEEAWRHVGFNS